VGQKANGAPGRCPAPRPLQLGMGERTVASRLLLLCQGQQVGPGGVELRGSRYGASNTTTGCVENLAEDQLRFAARHLAVLHHVPAHRWASVPPPRQVFEVAAVVRMRLQQRSLYRIWMMYRLPRTMPMTPPVSAPSIPNIPTTSAPE